MTEINIALTDPQKEFVFCKSPYPALVAGLGAGKTHAATVRFVLQMLSERGINVLMGMPTYDLLKLRAMPGFEDALNNIGIPYRTNKSDYSIEIIGYGMIYFRSYDRPERWIAFEVAKTILDELDTLPKDKAELVWRKATERTRQKCASGNSIGAVTTPDQGINGFVYDKWVKKAQSGYELIKASTMSNPFLPESYVEQIKSNYDPVLVQLYLNGDFVSLNQNKIYHFFDRVRHGSNRVLTDEDKHLHVSIDFNIGGCCATTTIYDGQSPITVDEFSSHDTRDFINNLVDRYKGKHITVYPDASGGAERTNSTASDIALIQQAGFNVDAPNKNPFVRDRINSVNGMISHDQWKVNVEKCPELVNALESQGYDKKGDPEKFNTHPAIDDWTDSFGYFMHRRHPIIKPVTNISFNF